MRVATLHRKVALQPRAAGNCNGVWSPQCSSALLLSQLLENVNVLVAGRVYAKRTLRLRIVRQALGKALDKTHQEQHKQVLFVGVDSIKRAAIPMGE